jgi:uncharacterized membrane protein HdeD (DUF308 family)
MAKKKEEMHEHHKGHGCMMLVLGLLVLGNAYWGWLNWAYFIGFALVLGGLCKMMMCCKKKK